MKVERSFNRVLDAARSGADWAWEELYRDLSIPVLSYLRASGADEPDDLLGEVFLQAVRDIGRFDGGEAELRAWVMTIARHRLIDARRRRARRPESPAGEHPGSERAGGDVEREALTRLGSERALALLTILTGEQREVILLRVVADLTVEQTAAVLGKRAGAVKQLQRRALLRLKDALAREGVTG